MREIGGKLGFGGDPGDFSEVSEGVMWLKMGSRRLRNQILRKFEAILEGLLESTGLFFVLFLCFLIDAF